MLFCFHFHSIFFYQQASVSPAKKKKKRKQTGLNPSMSAKKKLKKIPEEGKTKEEENHDEPGDVSL